jgi:radical SAM protein with 4Fe4S-binding SPASM domain
MIFGAASLHAMASQLSPARLLNASRIFFSYHRSKRLGLPRMSGLPVAMSIEPTTACNLRCPECPSGLRSFSRPTGMLDQALYRKIIADVAPHLQYLTFYFQGEPFLHPKFLDMVRYAADHKIFTATSTNGHYLSKETAKRVVESGLHRMIISVDGATQDTYEAYRVGGKLDKVWDGLQNLVEAKKAAKSAFPELVVQALVLKPNEKELPLIAQKAKDLGADKVVMKTAQIYAPGDDHPLILENDARSRYRKRPDGTWEIRGNLLNHCWRMWQSCVVTWDGKVVPCCFDKDAQHVLGDFQHQTMHEIWYGERYQNFRSSILRSRKEIDICTNCTEGTSVWAN